MRTKVASRRQYIQGRLSAFVTVLPHFGPVFRLEGTERSSRIRIFGLTTVFLRLVGLLATLFSTQFAAAGQQSVRDEQVESHSTRIEFPNGYTGPIPASWVEKGWIALFDNESLFGWRAESQADWRVEDGCICVDAGEPGLLRTTSQFDDFELRLEFSANESTNSGVFIRTNPKPTDPTADCFEINIAPADNPFPTASIVARKRVTEGNEIATNAAQFHLMEITCRDNRIAVSVDSKPMIEYQDDNPLGRGFIGLQLNRGAVRFRNIWLRPIWSTANARQDLSQWTPGGAVQSEPVADDGVRLTSGPGYLESPGQFGDFAFQAQCKIASGQNSGVFYRCIPGENQNGYESQIDNGWQNDRSKPTNAGTGAIFRRTQARRIVADDEAWFAKTFVATGPHVSVWVNGYQVTDWTDQRAADPNPRLGLRLHAGTIMFQAHDAATDVSFRNVWIDELAPRIRE